MPLLATMEMVVVPAECGQTVPSLVTVATLSLLELQESHLNVLYVALAGSKLGAILYS